MSTRKCDEKTLLPSTVLASANGDLTDARRARFSKRFKAGLITIAVLVVVWAHGFFASGRSDVVCGGPWWRDRPGRGHQDVCPQTDELVPSVNGAVWTRVGDLFNTESFRNRSTEALGGAVRIA